MKLYIRNLIEYKIELNGPEVSSVLTKTTSLQLAAVSLRDATNANETLLRANYDPCKRVMLTLWQRSALDDLNRWCRIATVYYDDDLGSIVMV